MITYKIKINPEYSITEKEIERTFTGEDSRKQLEEFLDQNGYSPTDPEVVSLIDNSGEYKGLNDTEFTIEIVKPEPTEAEVFVKNQGEFLKGKFLYFSDEETKSEIELIRSDDDGDIIIENSEYTDITLQAKDFEKFISGEDVGVMKLMLQEESIEEEKEEEQEQEEEIELDKFNDSDLFVDEFESYLTGKSIVVDSYKTKINSIKSDSEENQVEIFYYIESKEELSLILASEDFQSFIDGDKISTESYQLELILQEEPEVIEPEKPKSLNNPDFKYYILNSDNKILGGFEYKEEASHKLEKLKQFGEDDIVVLQRKDITLDLENNENWLTNQHDWAIIAEAIKEGADKSEYSPKQAEKVIEGFKTEGKYAGVVKARLLFSLKAAQDKMRSAFMNSNIERVDEKTELINRIQKELKRIISMEA